MPNDWDAGTYDQIADPQTRWGAAVVERLSLSGDERILDAGCGSGRVTALLLPRLPRGHVIALDASPSMVEQARGRLGDSARIEYLVADLARPLPLTEAVDGVLSTATFHWIADHDALFRNLAAVLRPGGWLVAQCGGAGNIDSVRRAVRQLDPGLPWNKNFATAEETTRRLNAAGFSQARAWLQVEPTPLPPGEPLETFLRVVILREVLEQVPADRRDGFVRDVAARLPNATLDYVRLNIEARRA